MTNSYFDRCLSPTTTPPASLTCAINNPPPTVSTSWHSSFPEIVLLVFFIHLVIILLNNGTAIAIMTAPNAIMIIRSIEMSDIPAPSTMTFRMASEA